MNIDITQVVLAVIAVISSIITTFLIPLLKAKLDVEKSNLTENQANMLRLAITTAVTAAEQLFNSDEGKAKKSYVLNLLAEQGYDVNSDAVDAAIEAEVKNLKLVIEDVKHT